MEPGRLALVTGSSRGIGLALARGLLGAGHRVVLNGRDGPALAAAQADLGGEAAGVHVAAFDTADEPAVLAAVADIEARVGPLDVLVANAGVQHREPLLDVDVADVRRVIDVDLTAAFVVARAAARGMVARGRGHIVTVCSVQSRLARRDIGAYTAAKHGLVGLTRAMCAEWAGHGLVVNALAPGYIETDLTRPLREDPDFDRWLRGRTPSGRWGTVEDLVGPLLFLVGEGAAYVNGQVLAVDGGLTAVV